MVNDSTTSKSFAAGTELPADSLRKYTEKKVL